MKKLWIILGSIFGFLLLGVGLYFLEESYTRVVLHGKKITEATIYEEYLDQGFDLFHNNRLIPRDSYTFEMKSDVNKEIIGEYKVTYDIKYHLRKFHIERIVHVVDNVKPVITANLEKIERDYCTRKDKKTLTYQVMDNYDGEIKENIQKEEIEDKMVITAVDASGNIGTLSIPIDYGKAPDNVIKLNGSSTIYVKINGTYKEEGAGYFDGCGKKLDEKVQTSGSVNTKKAGNYTITYSVSDGTKKTRKVVVYQQASGNGGRTTVTGSGNGKIIYLTFDDGPGQYTQKILNTLAKYNVKATFFVTGNGNASLMSKEYQLGHTVAVHTYSHNYATIYKSVDAYVNDFNKINNIIEKQTGSKSKLFRFPGGSSNTVSRSYSKGVVTKIANYMNNAGYRYFDWDVDSGDAAGASRSKIYNNVVNGVKYCKTCIVLMHDIKANTANELDNILSTLTSKGYRFGTLSMSSPTVHHKIAN